MSRNSVMTREKVDGRGGRQRTKESSKGESRDEYEHDG